MKRRIISLLIVLSLECILSLTYYPKVQRTIKQVQEELKEARKQLKALDDQLLHLDELEVKIKDKEVQKDKIQATDTQLLDLFKKIESYPFQEVHYKKLKEEQSNQPTLTSTYVLSTVGHYNNLLDLIENISTRYAAIYLKSLQLDNAVQNKDDPTNRAYVQFYGDKLSKVFLMKLEWIVYDKA